MVTVTAQPGEQANLIFTATNTSVAPAQTTAGSSASGLFRGTGLATTATAGAAKISDSASWTFDGVGRHAGNEASKAILPWALVDVTATGNGTSFATADTTAGLRPLAASEYVNNTTVVPTNNVLLNTGTFNITASVAPNSITFDNSANLTMNSMVLLTNSSGGILVRTGSISSITGGVINQTNGLSPLDIWTPQNTGDTTTLTINTPMNGRNGVSNGDPSLIKAGAGTLTLNAPQSYIFANNSADTMTGLVAVNEGTLKLSSLTNTLSFNNFLEVGLGGTLDLNGSSQFVEALFTDGAVANTSGGTVTNTALTAATLIANNDNTARAWAGTITGDVGFQRAGQNTLSLYSNNTYTGPTLITGGTTVLRDQGQLSGTTSIDVNYATLQADNNVGTNDFGDRINDAAPITLRGGTLTLIGRAGLTASSGTVERGHCGPRLLDDHRHGDLRQHRDSERHDHQCHRHGDRREHGWSRPRPVD